MKINLFLSILLTSATVVGYAQSGGTLKFKQAKLITNSIETVPANHVWKITAVYGTVEGCHLIGACYTALSPLSYAFAKYTGFQVEGTEILSSRIYVKGNFFSNNTCTNDPRSWTTGNPPLCSTMATDLSANPNILPFWLGEGKTLKASAAGIFLSVIEFEIE
ncbi:MAG: hypothetical protein IT223_02720 [Crocinitomicaceae bacterium]|nr:hypothetical protein [Crocinitomicaceae bacterium]